MSPHGRPKGSYRSTQCEGTPVSAVMDQPLGTCPSSTRGRSLRVAVGDSHSRSFTVTRERCISNLVAGLPSIMGTYALVEWMEISAYLCIGECLDPDQLSVAESIDVRHYKAVGEGSEVFIEALVRQVLGHRVGFDIQAHVDGVKVGECNHVRAVVPRRLLDRVAERVAAGATVARRATA
jgi:predicted thioesterase